MEFIGNPLQSIEDSKVSTKGINTNVLGFDIIIHLPVDISQLQQIHLSFQDGSIMNDSSDETSSVCCNKERISWTNVAGFSRVCQDFPKIIEGQGMAENHVNGVLYQKTKASLELFGGKETTQLLGR